ncbi:C4-dicarboxylate ABC transporter [Dechloromonas sp. HYN0024]|uniref:SLAC1 family transporter n=1 Tax=Dechloromonas sp. HYN0024 TaxID=2231055 RepID=UPI000E442544|nr:C4-dicarboxylate ABC transporter [Dechloromonas sp. HYN0024]AXS79127.1 C4-dicarboxylate ABC transporter [Dechloromonas sp. HYN0024]
MSYPGFSDISRSFAPGWFAAVMGTGVLALTTRSLGLRWPVLAVLAEALHWFNSVLFVLLAVPWLNRWLSFRSAAVQTLHHPVQANFYPTFSIALLVLAAQWLAFASCVEVAMTLWWLGVILHFTFSFVVLFIIFRGDQVGLDHVTPAHFIPAVGLVVMPLAGGPLLGHLDGVWREWALTINVVGLGAGSMMYIGLFGLALHRHYLHKPAAGILTPTIWIHLAPIGVIPVSLLNVVEQLPYPAAREGATVLMLLIWGFGVWWLVMACLLTLAARRAGQLPFALSWWGFTFPVGAFVGESLRLTQVLGWSSTLLVGVGAWLLLCFFWSVTLYRTLRGVASGAIFQPHP